MTKLYA